MHLKEYFFNFIYLKKELRKNYLKVVFKKDSKSFDFHRIKSVNKFI